MIFFDMRNDSGCDTFKPFYCLARDVVMVMIDDYRARVVENNFVIVAFLSKGF